MGVASSLRRRRLEKMIISEDHNTTEDNVEIHYPFRNSSLLKAEPKSIHEIGEFGNKHVIPDAAPTLDTPFRNSSLLMAEPRSIYEGGEVGNKYVVPNKNPEDTPFRTSTLLRAEPKSIYDVME